MNWIATLPARSVRSFSDLAGSFVSQFAANRVKRLEGGSLKSYLARFNNATVRVDDPDQKFFVKAFQKGLRVDPFSDALALRRPSTMEEICARAEKHVEVEEDQTKRLEVERLPNHKESKLGVQRAQQKGDAKRQTQAWTHDAPQIFTPLREKRM
ncbi:hypothetical protein CR513_23893, partial [Mucuna pruriens]